MDFCMNGCDCHPSIYPIIHQPFDALGGVPCGAKSGFHRVVAICSAIRFAANVSEPNTREIDMKKILLIAGAAAALILTGCNQGGTSDQYGTSSGTATSSNSMNNAHTVNSNTPVSPP
jgi:hypothetical protein